MITTRYRAKLIGDLYTDQLQKVDKVLDVGCGNCIVGEYLSKRFSLKLVGTDILFYPKVDIPVVKMEGPDRLPFEDNSFDVVLFNDMLHHTELKKDLVAEGLRVGSKILIFEMEPTWIAKIVDRVLNFFHNPGMEVPLAFFRKDEWTQLLEQLDCQYIIEVVKKPFKFYPLQHLYIKIERK